jgi:predicted DNA-binding ribbon-helix-helix protein
MATLTIRLPDEKHDRLKQLAESRGISMNKLIEELSTIALTEFDTANRFRVLAARGDRARGLALLDQLDERSELDRR